VSGTKSAQVMRVEQWLLSINPGLADIDFDLDLIDNRVIDSVRFMEFLFFLEELVGREIEFDGQSLGSFRTLRAIEKDIICG
jgi:acyl carrier protein